MKSYLARFNQAALKIKDLSQVIAMHSILFDLKMGDFSKSLAKRPPQTMMALLVRSAKFINMEEVKAIKRHIDCLTQEDRG